MIDGIETPDEVYDLRGFFRSVGRFTGERGGEIAAPDREAPDHPAELLDSSPLEVNDEPIPVGAFIDGIQASLIVAWREHRPVYLQYIAAGALGPEAKPVGLRERLQVVASSADREWLDEIGCELRIEEIVATEPPAVEQEASKLLGSIRENLERALVEDLIDQSVRPLIVDGTLIGRAPRRDLLGVVKTHRTRYLEDESVLWRLPAGWRSPRFKIEASGGGGDRYSCYLRLFDASQHSWHFGLIRLEAFHPDQLDPLASRCLNERQHPAAGDPRWDRHLAGVHACEEFMRARRPAIFSM